MPPTPTITAFRYGYGLPLPKDAPTTPDRMLAALSGPDRAAALWPSVDTDMALAHVRAVDDARRRGKTSEEEFRKSGLEVRDRGEAIRMQVVRASVARALDSPDGFRERLVAFWADHFTVASKNLRDRPMPGALAEDAIRPNVSRRFADMLIAVELHPAMLMYLNQDVSVGPESPQGRRTGRGLNENLAREIMELHTLGVGASYSQTDVRQMAELLTGLTVKPEEGFIFRETWVEPGDETVLGVTYTGEGLVPIHAALEALAVQPETAAYVSWKLAVHFVADDPDPDLVGAMTSAWRDSGGDLMAVYGALLGHPSAWTPTAAKARQPAEFLIAGLRSLGLSGADLAGMDDKSLNRALLNPMQAMGQPWQQPPGPDGWPEAPEKWINPVHLATRITWSMTVPQKLVQVLPDPRDFVQLALGDQATEAVVLAASRAESAREGVGIVLASPEFNRR